MVTEERDDTMEIGKEERKEEEEKGGTVGDEDKGKKKRGRKPKDAEEKKVSTAERPTRERKTVERFSAMSPQSVSATKTLSIKQGPGTQLKDIPNVFYKLSKRKTDENIKLLHSLLFGKKAKAILLKRNICQFSGFVWSKNDEKEKMKVKEKLDRVVKDKLLDFCDILDVPVSRTTMKKEDISAKLFEFLESPRATRDVILADKEKKKKEKKRKSRSKASSESKSGGDPETVTKKQKRTPVKPDKDESESGDDADDKKATSSDDEPHKRREEKQVEKSESGSGEEEQDDTSPEEKVSVKKKTGKGSSGVSPSKKGRSKEKQEKSKESEPRSSTTGKRRASKKDKEPTKEELQAVVRDILKEVDFNTATLADILKQLGTRFRVDLMHRKAEVKGIIEEVINDMTDDEEAED